MPDQLSIKHVSQECTVKINRSPNKDRVVIEVEGRENSLKFTLPGTVKAEFSGHLDAPFASGRILVASMTPEEENRLNQQVVDATGGSDSPLREPTEHMGADTWRCEVKLELPSIPFEELSMEDEIKYEPESRLDIIAFKTIPDIEAPLSDAHFDYVVATANDKNWREAHGPIPDYRANPDGVDEWEIS